MTAIADLLTCETRARLLEYLADTDEGEDRLAQLAALMRLPSDPSATDDRTHKGTYR